MLRPTNDLVRSCEMHRGRSRRFPFTCGACRLCNVALATGSVGDEAAGNLSSRHRGWSPRSASSVGSLPLALSCEMSILCMSGSVIYRGIDFNAMSISCTKSQRSSLEPASSSPVVAELVVGHSGSCLLTHPSCFVDGSTHS